MALEASIVERLQELRKWQMDQQDRLLKQQHEQRELLTIEQERMYEALGVTAKDIIEDESFLDQLSVSKFRDQIKSSGDIVKNDINKNDELQNTHSHHHNDEVNSQDESVMSDSSEQSSNMQLTVPAVTLKSIAINPENSPAQQINECVELEYIGETPRRFRKEHFNLSIESNERFSLGKSFSQSMLIDEIPVPSPKKDFTTLLEEKLKDCEHDIDANKELESGNRVKRPFLRKGQGLARFRMKPTGNLKNKSVKSSNFASSTKVQVNKLQKSISENTIIPTQQTKNLLKNKKTKEISRKSTPTAKIAQKKFNLNNVKLPTKKLRSTKSLSPSTWKSTGTTKNVQLIDEASNSDLDSSKLEMKMFELLEEKAENSSFCSTSSAVMAFMQQSTPSKLKNIFKNLSSKRQVLNGIVCENNVSTSNKIVHSLKRNKINQWSPVKPDQQIIAKQDFGLCKWNSGPFVNGSTELNMSCSTEIDTASNDSDRDTYDNFSTNSPPKSVEKDDANVSMHVRFAEYNEYKTFGLTDTSIVSSDSQSVTICADEKSWSDDMSDSESSDVKILPLEDKLNFCNDNNQLTSAAHFENTDSEETDYDEDNAVTQLVSTMKVLDCNDLSEKSVPNSEVNLSIQDEHKTNPQLSDDTNDTIFKSELLKNRLLELEREIDIFRKENAALSQQRQKLYDDHRQLQAELKAKAESLDSDRHEMELAFQEEKKRLAREKAALESRLRDSREKCLESKKERQQVQNLKEQLEQLKEEMIDKENRWQAAQARQRSEIRVIQMENAKLKQEIKRLQETKRGNGKLKRPNILSNTQAIHQINKQLDGHRVSHQTRECQTNEQIEAPDIVSQKNSDDNKISHENVKVITYESMQKSSNHISNKRILYEKLLQEASSECHDIKRINTLTAIEKPNAKILDADNDLQITTEFEDINKSSEEASDSAFNKITKPLISTANEENTHDYGKSQLVEQQSNGKHSQITPRSYQQFIHQVAELRNAEKTSAIINQRHQQNYYPSNETKLHDEQDKTHCESEPRVSDGIKTGYNQPRDHENEPKKPMENKYLNMPSNRLKLVCPSDPELTPREEHVKQLPQPPDNLTPHADLIHISQVSTEPNDAELPISPLKSNIREVNHPDGHTEYWYPNGNVKRVYPDRNITKMIYYNGDVRETSSDGTVKYFYATTNTWHTTYPDGFEVLEFPNGQQERRTKDGVVEVSFPDGSIRLMQPDGIEKWALPDGTIAETFPNGNKILSLPNGQREVHTSAHKRREYPDGTVKFVYPDGSQETRYSNGRIRMRDKDGNLIMDSHQT